MLKYRSQRLALAVSLLIHLLVLVTYRPLVRIKIFPDRSEAAHARTAEPLVFELVETPEDAVWQRPEAAILLSDKNALERDEYQDNCKAIGEAYSEGHVPYRVFAGQSGSVGTAQALSQMLQTKGSLNESLDQVHKVIPDRSSENLDSHQLQIPSMELENHLMLHTDLDRHSAKRRFIDDLSYDQRSSSAEKLGGISLNTYAWDFSSYILEMKKKLKTSIYPPAAFTQLGMFSGETVLIFKVLPDGRATDIEVIDYKGDRSLMETSVDAVKIASPFRPLPPDFPEEYLELRWTFIYFVYH